MSTTTKEGLLSELAEHIIGSEIIKLAGEVNAKIAQGEKIFNLTIGDFNPAVFPIPAELTAAIQSAYQRGETNYPAGDGMLALRTAVCNLIRERQGLDYSTNEMLIAGGARPLIYAAYQTLVSQSETVVFPVPSWNNNHYTYLTHAKPIAVETTPDNKFMPTVEELLPHLGSATLLALCSPLNPTGTTFTTDGLRAICSAVIDENNRRLNEGRKPLYILYDQIYWELTYGDVRHIDPVSLYPELRNYTIFIDGISKSLSATGVRVGWAFGPARIIDSMKNILSHIGAWAPKAEQLATAEYLNNRTAYTSFLTEQRTKAEARLQEFYEGFTMLKNAGHPVSAIAPEAAIYLTIRLSLHGKITPEGKLLEHTRDVTKYILDSAKIAVVPFSAFGADSNSPWYRLSVGTCKLEDVVEVISSLKTALEALR